MNYTENEINLIIADSIKFLYYKYKKLLLASVNPNLDDREKYADALIKSVGSGVYNKAKALFSDGKYRDGVLKDLERRKIECVTFKSADYPPLLKQISFPPLVLYVRGRRELLSGRMFAVVGSRRISSSVAECCKRICSELSEYLTIVTGVADGGDSAAVYGALKTGNVICVLPGGHDSGCCRNVNMLKTVESEGLSVTEFAPETPVQSHTFSLRNRVMAGMSEGLLVVSAGEQSGTKSAVEYATGFGRDLFAFPHSIGVASGTGCNKLIKDGAALCDCADDVLFAMGIQRSVKNTETPNDFDGNEAAVLNLLKEEGEMHAEKIAAALGLSLSDVVSACSMLEIKGYVTPTGGNSFAVI
ncbi:MAG: DNA-protecting protein DprA [Clostridia bacterium]|nr:DNA-protecting protein DprA [Clostridia bacterium]